jgi:hypothetical protein
MLSWIIPNPTLVEAPTGSQLWWKILPLRLGDLAALETWVTERAGHPLEGERVRLRVLRHRAGGDYRTQETPESVAYADFLWQYQYLRDHACCWPVGILTEPGQEILNTPEGRLEFLWTLLARTNPGWDREKLRPVLEFMDLEAWLTLESIAYGRLPQDELSRLMDPGEPGEVSWCREIYRMCEEYYTLDFNTIGRLFISQWVLIRSKGQYVPGAMHGSDRWRETAGWGRSEAIERMARRHEGNGTNGTNGTGHP